MSLESKKSLHEGQLVRDKMETAVAAAKTLDVYDQMVRCAAGPATGAFAITLPRVNEAKGRIYAIHCTDADGTNAITVQDQDESEDWTDITLNGPLDGVLLYSDGKKWWTLSTDVSNTGTTAAPTTVAQTTAAPTTAAPTTAL